MYVTHFNEHSHKYLAKLYFACLTCFYPTSWCLFQRVIGKHGADWRNGATTTNSKSNYKRGFGSSL